MKNFLPKNVESEMADGSTVDSLVAVRFQFNQSERIWSKFGRMGSYCWYSGPVVVGTNSLASY
jgi:hypothetical protein